MKNLIKVITFIFLTVAAFPLLAYPGCHNNSEVMQQFKKLDVNGDALISKEEVKAQPEFTKNMAISIFGAFEMGDVNTDGVLDLSEFVANEKEMPVE